MKSQNAINDKNTDEKLECNTGKKQLKHLGCLITKDRSCLVDEGITYFRTICPENTKIRNYKISRHGTKQ